MGKDGFLAHGVAGPSDIEVSKTAWWAKARIGKDSHLTP
jgi:hypothetical protein